MRRARSSSSRARRPRPCATHIWSYNALRALRDRLIATLDRIRRADFTYAVGTQCRWCPCAAHCVALAATARDSVATKLAAPELVAAGEFGAATLDAALELAPALDHWVRQTAKVAEAYLLAGGKLKSRKLVPETARRPDRRQPRRSAP